MSERHINVGIIGVGFMGATHLAAYQRAARDGYPCRVVAFCDSKPRRRAGDLADVGGNIANDPATSLDLQNARAYEKAGDLIADPGIDLISISTHTDTHVELATAAMRAGKHVLLEKPVALTAGPVRRLADVAAECGVVCMPAMCMRFWPAWTWLKQTVDNGRFGEVTNARFTRLGCRPGWSEFYLDNARAGGALLDLHIHDTDFIAHLFGEPAMVFSTGTIDHLTTIYGYSHIPHVVAEGGWDQHPAFSFTMRYLVNFERATLDFDIARDPQLLLCRDGRAITIDLEPISGYDGEIRHLIDSLRANRRPALTLHDAAVTHAILDAERQSLQSGQPTRLAEVAAGLESS